MKAQLFGNTTCKGGSTLELLIAFSILIVCVSAVILVVFSNQVVAVDSQTNVEAIYRAKHILESARAKSRQDFAAVISTTSTATSTIPFTQTLEVADITKCKKLATSTVSWSVSPLRSLSITLTTFLTDIAGALALGGDCASAPSTGNWDNPQIFASDTITPGKPTAIDALERVVYLGADKAPFFYIADTKSMVLGQSSGLFVTYTNGFNLGSTTNALDAVRFVTPATGAVKRYVFVATDSKNEQLAVIDVTDMYNPVRVATRSLKNVSAAGSYPQGYRVSYFKDRLYVLTRETTGNEFHTFDVSDPTNPIELGNGIKMGITINDIAVTERILGGISKRIIFMATSQDSAEVKVYDATDMGVIGALIEIVAARQNLPGIQNGLSIDLIGAKLYLGRQSSLGADLYVFDSFDPTLGMPQLGSADIGTSVVGLRVVGRYGFLATSKTNQEFQIWNIENLSSITLIKNYNFGNVIAQGVDYEPDFIYATGLATPNLQILYSP